MGMSREGPWASAAGGGGGPGCAPGAGLQRAEPSAPALPGRPGRGASTILALRPADLERGRGPESARVPFSCSRPLRTTPAKGGRAEAPRESEYEWAAGGEKGGAPFRASRPRPAPRPGGG